MQYHAPAVCSYRFSQEFRCLNLNNYLIFYCFRRHTFCYRKKCCIFVPSFWRECYNFFMMFSSLLSSEQKRDCSIFLGDCFTFLGKLVQFLWEFFFFVRLQWCGWGGWWVLVSLVPGVFLLESLIFFFNFN